MEAKKKAENLLDQYFRVKKKSTLWYSYKFINNNYPIHKLGYEEQ